MQRRGRDSLDEILDICDIGRSTSYLQGQRTLENEWGCSEAESLYTRKTLHLTLKQYMYIHHLSKVQYVRCKYTYNTEIKTTSQQST